MKLGLEHIRALMKRLDHPEQTFPSVHIAGTNGKGSTAAILESILRYAGYRTGLYTSPHLVDMRERILIRGKPISKKEVIKTIQFLMSHIEATNVSFFEILTALAFLHFFKYKIDIAVLETGLGGRLDATSVVHPLLTILTEIGLDHIKILGKDIQVITGEKAGIMKSGVPCIAGTKSDVVKHTLIQIGIERKVPLRFLKNEIRLQNIHLTDKGSRFDYQSDQSYYTCLKLNLLGEHQVDNAALAITAVDMLRKMGWTISDRAIRKGLQKVIWKARLQVLQTKPILLLDSAHNPMGTETLVSALTSIFTYNRLILVFGVLEDKDYQSMCQSIVPLADTLASSRCLLRRSLGPEAPRRCSLWSWHVRRGPPLARPDDPARGWRSRPLP